MRSIGISARRGWLMLSSLVVVGLISASIGAALVSSVTPTPRTSIIANRIQVPSGTQRAFLMRLPSLGYLYVDCIDGGTDPARVYWKNSETYAIDAWTSIDETQPAPAVAPSTVLLLANLGTPGITQRGEGLDLGRGVSPGVRRTVHVDVGIARSALNAPCVAQAVATSWASQ